MARRPGSRQTRRASSLWPDLPWELLGVVLLRLSLADRARLGAVCRAWRDGARLQPLPAPAPWLILRNGTFLDLADNTVRRMPVPDGALCRGSVEDWLLTAFWREAYAPVQQGYLGPPSKLYAKKVAVSWERDEAVSWEHDDDGSSRRRSPVLAAVVHDRLTHFESFKVLVCRPGAGSSPSSSMEFKRGGNGNVFRDVVQDVAFFKGVLYVVHHDGELRAFDLGEDCSYAREVWLKVAQCQGWPMPALPLVGHLEGTQWKDFLWSDAHNRTHIIQSLGRHSNPTQGLCHTGRAA
ncbi:hypothetical protein ACP70R_041853 [Stipagrostis hirtigluma subsp. patula]